MSVTTSPPAFADPLADDVLPPPSFTPTSETVIPGAPARQGSLTRDRAALLAPDVEGQTGTDAIELVRSSGLIAAIETVESAEDSQQGLVIEQNPPPGTQMAREGVLTLQVAQAPAEPQGAQDDALTAEGYAESSPAASDEYEDDTEQWFANLGPSAPAGPSPESAPAKPPRRRRKHRRAPIPVTGVKSQPALQDQFATGLDSGDTLRAAAPLEVPPDPLPSAWDSPTKELPNLSREPAPPGHLTSLIAAVLVRLPDRSVMPTWRRRALVIAGAVLGLLLVTRVGASISHDAASAPLAQPHVSRRAGVALGAVAVAPARNRLTTSRHPHRSSAQRPDLTSPRHPSAHAPRASITATAGAADPVPTSTSSSPPPAPASEEPGPFVYLGK